MTQYTEQEQVLRQLRRDGTKVDNDVLPDGVKVVTLAWLSACLKAGKVMAVEDKHVVKCKQDPQVCAAWIFNTLFLTLILCHLDMAIKE